MKASEKAISLCHAIECAGASEALTKCSVLAADLLNHVQRMEMALTVVQGYGRSDMGHQQMCDYVTETASDALL